MTIRIGMTNIINILSDWTNPGTEVTQDHMQDVLDRMKTYYKYVMLTPDITRTSPLTAIYIDYYLPDSIGEWFELPQDGVIDESFKLETFMFEPVVWGTGANQAQYNDNIKRIRLGSDQHGSYYFLSLYSYDLYGAAAEIWRQKAAARQALITVKTDNHSLNMEQERDFCVMQYQYYRSLSDKQNQSKFVRSDQGVGYARNPMNISRRSYYGNS